MRKAAGAHHAHLVRHFERRLKATKEGLHLPSEDELLLGMGFLCGDIFTDAKEACNRWLKRLRSETIGANSVDIISFVEAVTVAPDPTSILLLSNVLHGALYDDAGNPKEDKSTSFIDGLFMRCRIYLAHLDMPGAARDIALESIKRFYRTEREYYKYSIKFAYSGLAWAVYALDREERQLNHQFGGWLQVSPIQHNAAVRLLVETIINEGIQDNLDDEKKRRDASRSKSSEKAEPLKDLEVADNDGSRIVLKEIGNSDITEGKRVYSAFKPICGIPLRLVSLPDLTGVQRQLDIEAPHARKITQEILASLVGQSYVHLSPTILVGNPGCGKTRYARRLFELLGVKHQIISCGGVADGNWGGTARRWSTGEPSLPLSALLRTKTANPGLILDEVEKVGTDRNNGNAAESILAMLETETAERFIDPYVQGECDISLVSWMMTANDLKGVHAPFRDRCRVIRFPEPGREHRRHFVRQLLKEMASPNRFDEFWFRDLTIEEYSYVERLWKGGSLRRLQKIIRGIVTARVNGRTLH